MIIAGLDLSLTSSGVAILVDGTPKAITHVGHKGRSAANYQQRSRRVRSQVAAVMQVIWRALDGMRCHDGPDGDDPLRWADWLDLAVIEAPLLHGPAQAYEFDRAALWHGVYGALEARRVPIAVVNPQTLKLWFTGNGAASKLDMCNAAMARFREPISTHDEADAVALCTAGAYHLDDPIPWEPCERSRECLSKVEWPEVVKA